MSALMLQSRIRRWNTTALFSVELESNSAGQVFDAARRVNSHLPELHNHIPANSDNDPHAWELIIRFRSKGYYDPGKAWGNPETCYPPEGDDERTLVDAWISRTGGGEPAAKFPLPQAVAGVLFEEYRDEIQNAELPDCDDRP